MTIDLDQLVADCQQALGEDRPQGALKEVLQRAVSRPADLLAALPADQQQSIPVHVSDELTILQVVNAPGFVYLPHDHGSWSACAYYAGRERNTFYRRTDHGLEQVSGKEYDASDVSLMGADAIHAIENPLRTNNAALHVFAGNPFTATCSQWDLDRLEEAPFDIAYVMSVYPTPTG
jgi:predicted metal-dependent enzyme (double-stranded beta helix superfamily)